MKEKSIKITRVICLMIVSLLLNTMLFQGKIAYGDVSDTTGLDSLLKTYEDENLYVKEGISLYIGENFKYDQLIQPEEKDIEFQLTSSNNNVVAVKENNSFEAISPGQAYIMLKSENGVYAYEVIVKEDEPLEAQAYENEGINDFARASNGSYRVFVDAGHGGKDSGAVGFGILEKNLTLAIALKTELALKAKGVDVVMSRNTDKFLELSEISSLGNSSGADVFTSIHINSVANAPSANGIETYYYSGKTDSQKLANDVQNNLIKSTGANNRKVKTANFHVIREVKIPSILVECGFISNYNEATLMNTSSYQQLLAQGIANGIYEYLVANVPLPNAINGQRIAGLNRYETSYKVARTGWSTADTVIIAAGANYPDALCSAPLASKYNAPILLAENTSLSNQNQLKDILKSLNVKTAFIVGGTTVLSNTLENDIKNLGITTNRLAGSTRYETAVKVAEKVGNNGKIALVSGLGFADALSISSVAAQLGMPILLTEQNDLTNVTKQYINGKPIDATYIVGGTTAISGSLDRMVPNPIRLSGLTRYSTNQNVFNYFKGNLNLSNSYLAVGTDFPDALSVSALAGKNKSFVFLSRRDYLENPLVEMINGNRTRISTLYVLGGQSLITDAILSQLNIKMN